MSHFARHRQKYYGALILLGIELVLGIALGIFFFVFYEKLTVKQGEIQKIQPQKPVALPSFSPVVISQTGNVFAYSGTFGSLFVGYKTHGDSLFITKELLIKNININYEKISTFLLCKQLYQNGMIDGHMALYLFRQSGADIPTIITHRNILLGYTKNKKITVDTNRINQELTLYQQVLKQEKYPKLIHYLETLEKTLKDMQNDQRQFLTLPVVSTKEFSYLLDKIHRDKNQTYTPALRFTIDTFGIKPNLIKATILTEQLRTFFTYRGVAKKLIANQRFMMIMQQASWGIGGIKEKTAKSVESRLATTYPELFRQYIAFKNPTTEKAERYARLTDTKNYFYQILYIGATLAMYIDQRKQAGIDIKKDPGVIMTLYNIGFKKPHPNPSIGGSSLSFVETTMPFGTWGLFFWYWLEMYG